jgi:hypothetical protein
MGIAIANRSARGVIVIMIEAQEKMATHDRRDDDGLQGRGVPY